MTITLTPPTPTTHRPPPRRRHGPLIAVLAVTAAALAGIAAATVAALQPPAGTTQAAPPTAVATTAAPDTPVAPAPGGREGRDWHRTLGAQPWAPRVRSVDVIGDWLVLGTDLDPGDPLLLVVCEAGRGWLAGRGAPAGDVIVYGSSGADVWLVLARDGGACGVLAV